MPVAARHVLDARRSIESLSGGRRLVDELKALAARSQVATAAHHEGAGARGGVESFAKRSRVLLSLHDASAIPRDPDLIGDGVGFACPADAHVPLP